MVGVPATEWKVCTGELGSEPGTLKKISKYLISRNLSERATFKTKFKTHKYSTKELLPWDRARQMPF